ncbi:MAG TPA: response regulator transcription factor [Thermoanaerobaculia bacterium]|nr:response regulator transcription factor [Thermoanaerobaculia bacterium]
MFSIVLADDHALVRRGLAALLATDGRFTVVAEAGNGEDALIAVRDTSPDALLLDLSMPRIDGLETLRRLRLTDLRTRVLVLSMYDDAQFVAQALADGADGYLLKHAMDDELFSALEAVLAGQRYVSRSIDFAHVEALETARSSLTAREREVLQLIADGHTTQHVAEILGVSPHTATRHRANLMQKLDAHNQVELVRAAVARGLILMPRGAGG